MKNLLIYTYSFFILTSCTQDMVYLVTEKYKGGQKKIIEVLNGDRLVKRVYYFPNGNEQSIEEYNQNLLVLA